MVEPEELPDAEYDGPWKEALEFGLDLFLVEFEPALHAAVDWTQDYESLDKELQRLFPASETGVRHADLLFKLMTWSGDPLYLHAEVQAFAEDLFGSRLMTYRHRLRDWLKVPVVTVAILADDNLTWCPNRHEEGRFGSVDICTWHVVKLVTLNDKRA